MSRIETPVSRYLRCAGRELHCTEWGSRHASTLVAWHNLARTGREMATLRGRIERLVLNDNGPSLAPTAIDRIRSYAGASAAFATVQ